MKNQINLGALIAWLGVVIYLIAALLIKDLFWSMIIIWAGVLTTLLGCYFWVKGEATGVVVDAARVFRSVRFAYNLATVTGAEDQPK